MLPNAQEWRRFYDIVKAKTGVDLDLYRSNQLQRRTVSMVESLNLKSLDEFTKWFGESATNQRWFLDKMAINVSELFRNPEKWTEMINKVLPELGADKKGLKVWSAGCSYGAEAHTLAMILDQKFRGRHQILGTDIDQDALDQAKRGEFSESDVRWVPREYKSTYLRQEGNKWFATDVLRSYLTFRKGNLLADRFDSGYDLIMCRNVVIYFTDEAKEELYRKFYNALRPGGILFVGSTERVTNYRDLGFDTGLPFFYRKPLEGNNQWRNAS